MVTTTKRMRRINRVPKKGWKKLCDKMNHLNQQRWNNQHKHDILEKRKRLANA